MNDQRVEEQAYKTAVEAAIAASKLVLQYWPNMANPFFNEKLVNDVFQKEGVGNYATVADKESEKLIINFITSQTLLKDHRILSEESDEIIADSPYQWIIDPIDGTQPFKNGLEEFGICIGLLKNQEPVIGVIALPAKNEFVAARKNHGAILQDLDGGFHRELKRDSGTVDFEKVMIGYDVGYTDREVQLDSVKKIIGKVGYCVSYASVAAANCFLAQGYLGGYFSSNPTKFDIAAAAAIVQEIGILTDMKGNPIDWSATSRSYLAARSSEVHQHLLSLLNS